MFQLQNSADQETGWPSAGDCDGALWAGEALAAGDIKVKLDLAEGTIDGVIKRSPTKLCKPASRDMVLGYAYGMYQAKNLGALQRLADYGESHGWYMSDDLPNSSIDPSSAGVLGRAIGKLSQGTDKRGYAANPFLCLPPIRDFERHLLMLLFLFEGEVSGGIPTPCLDIANELKREYPSDALFQTVSAVYSGDFKTPMAELIGGYSCPSYVRGADNYCLVHKVFVENEIIKRHLGK